MERRDEVAGSDVMVVVRNKQDMNGTVVGSREGCKANKMRAVVLWARVLEMKDGQDEPSEECDADGVCCPLNWVGSGWRRDDGY